jgi:uncharacterized membrane protein YfcA
MALLIFLSTCIGLLLGLLGGGGSILTVPALVYLTELTTKSAITTSLIVVGLTSSITVINYARMGLVCWKTGITFGLAGMVGAFTGGKMAAYIPDNILLLLFTLVMLASSFSMLRKRIQKSDSNGTDHLCPLDLPLAAILFDGLLVGLITGLVGVGGGFLLVPALNVLAGLPIQSAIGTSLFIIVMQSSAALLGHLSHMQINVELTATITAFAILGSFIGTRLSRILPALLLKKMFGIFVLLLGCFLLYQEMSLELIKQSHALILKYQEFLTGAITILLILWLYRLWSWLHQLQKQ